MRRRPRPAGIAATFACCLTAAAAPVTTRPASAPAIPAGPGRFVFSDPAGDPTQPITVWTWAPDDLSPTSPILIVMHGTQRNGETYRDNWVEHARAKRVLLVAPEFPRSAFPGVAYNDGNVVDRSGKPIDRSRWAFTTIEHLFDEVKRVAGNRSATYFLYGHSAGGQFVERFVMCMPHARYARAVAANPGWYTLPEQDKPFPAGLRGTPTTDDALRAVVRRDVVVLLGEKDTNPDDAELPRYPAAMAEGPCRFARGQFFFKDLQATAARLNVPLAWQLKTVPDAGHSDRQMSAAAADLLFPPPRSP